MFTPALLHESFSSKWLEICNMYSETLEKCVFTVKMTEMSSVLCTKLLCRVFARLKIVTFCFLLFFSLSL